MTMNRRDFIASSGAIGAATTLGLGAVHVADQPGAETGKKPEYKEFSMKFAPHFGMFRHHAGDDPVAQLGFAADVGFSAWEDNGMSGRPVEEQKKIAGAMERLGIEMGIFVLNPSTAWSPSFSRNDKDDREKFLQEARDAVEVAKRLNTSVATVVLGSRHPRISLEYQTAYAIDQLRRACDILMPAGLTMVLEPLNRRDHPGMLLAEMGHAYEICRAVDSPSCKILNDLYHQQIAVGNLIPNIDMAWDEIAYFQIGDNPGRREPGTGEINYRQVFRHIKRKGYTGILGMEHGQSDGKAGELAVIEAYRACDPV